MKTITSFTEIMDLANQSPLYVRWSRGPAMDQNQGSSRDYVSGGRHNGLSCQQIPANRPELAAQMLIEYGFLRRKDAKIYCWVFRATQNGTDSDNAPTVDTATIEPVGKLSNEIVEKLSAYKDAYWAHRNRKPKTWAEGQEHLNNYPKLADYI